MTIQPLKIEAQTGGSCDLHLCERRPFEPGVQRAPFALVLSAGPIEAPANLSVESLRELMSWCASALDAQGASLEEV